MKRIIRTHRFRLMFALILAAVVGGTYLLGYYSRVQAGGGSPTVVQLHYRWRNDDGSMSAATWSSGSTDVASSTVGLSTPIRLRFGIDNTGTDIARNYKFQIEYGTNADCSTGMTAVPVVASCGSSAICMFDSPNFTSGAATGNSGNENGVTDGTGSFVAGQAVDDAASITGNVSVDDSPDEFTEVEYGLQVTSNAAGSTTYYFRVTNSGTALDTYSVCAALTTASANTAPTGTFNSASQKTDGSGVVDISVEIDDANDNDTKLKLDYEADATCDAWSDPTLAGPATADFNDSGGAPDVNNSNSYQVGTTATTRVITSSGSNTVLFDWNSATDQSSGNATMCLRLTANDDTADQASPATQTLTIDNVNPATPGSMTENTKTDTTVTLNLGTDSSDTNDPGTNNYRLFYKAGASAPAETDTEFDSAAFDSWDPGATIEVTGLSASTQYTFNIWAYDAYCQTSVESCTQNKAAAATPVTVTTNAPNTAPTGSFNSAAQLTDGSGNVAINMEVDDTDDNDTKIKLEYEADATCDSWSDPTMVSASSTADFNDSGGQPSVVNSDTYQIGTTATYRVITSSGSNTVIADWDSATDQASGNGTMCLRMTVNDDAADQATPATQTVTVDNTNPATPGNLTLSSKTDTTITLSYGSASSDTNDPGTNNYRLFYKAGTSGVAETDTEKDSTDFDAWNYGGSSSITVTGLTAGTAYVFNIWAYDTYCQTSVASCTKNKAAATEITITTDGPPTGSFNSASQKTDGTGVVDISIEVDDPNDEDTKAKLEYDVSNGDGCDTFLDPTLQTPITADFNDSGGAPDVNNSNAYQVGTTATTRIITSSGSNTVQFDWDSATDQSSGNTTMCLRLTVNDDSDDQTTPATQTVTIDNVNPATPGNLTLNTTTDTTVTFNMGTDSSDTNDPGTNNYRLFYKAGSSGVAETDTEFDTAAFDSWDPGATVQVTGLTASTTYTFNIWAYDTYCQTSVASCTQNKAPAAQEITVTTAEAAASGTETQACGTFADDTSVGTASWADPENAASENSAYAVATLGVGGWQSYYLKATNCGFTFDSGSTVDGIQMTLNRHKAALPRTTCSVSDASIKIVKGGNEQGTEKALNSWPDTTDADALYGGSTDKWGVTWLGTDISGNSGFGVAVSGLEDLELATCSAQIDYIEMKVWHSTPGGGNIRPLGTINSAAQLTDGSGNVAVNMEVDDGDQEDTKIKLEYDTDSGCNSWSDPTMVSASSTADFNDSGGQPSVVNSDTYQIGTTATYRVITTSGSNTVIADWDSATDQSAGDATMCLRMTVHDDKQDQSSPDIQTVTIDNVNPTTPGDMSENSVTDTTVTLNLGADSTDTNDPGSNNYRLFYKVGASAPTENDTEFDSAAFDSWDPGDTIQVTGLSASTQYTFRIWAYDTYCQTNVASCTKNKAPSAGSVTVTTTGGGNFATAGTFTSSSIDTTSYQTITQQNALRMKWSQSVPSGCVLDIYIRGTDADTAGDPDYTGISWTHVTSTATTTAGYYTPTTRVEDISDEADLVSKRWFQYKVDMQSCSSNNLTPELYDVQFEFD